VFSFFEVSQPKFCTNFLFSLVQIFHSSFFISSLLQEYEVKSEYCKVSYYVIFFIFVFLFRTRHFLHNFVVKYPQSCSSHLVRDRCLQLHTSDKTRKVDKLPCASCQEDMLGEWRYRATHLSTTLNRGQWSMSQTQAILLLGAATSTLCASPISDQDAVVKRKNSCPTRKWTFVIQTSQVKSVFL
jgi:hypothetical protein